MVLLYAVIKGDALLCGYYGDAATLMQLYGGRYESAIQLLRAVMRLLCSYHRGCYVNITGAGMRIS
jgi:hypothetical protein